MLGVSRRFVVMWIVAFAVLVGSASEALALKYVIPYPKDKWDAVQFKVTEENDGMLEFEVVIDEKKLGKQVVNFEIMAYSKSETGKRIGVTFSTQMYPMKEGVRITRFSLDRELAARASAEFAVAPFPGEGRDVPGGTFLAFRLRDFVDFSRDGELTSGADQLTPEDQRRVTNYEKAHREQTRVGSEKNPLPKVRPIPREE